MPDSLHVHLVSDSTGETVGLVARSCLVQFENCRTHEHVWNMIRSTRQMNDVIDGITATPGVVLYTLVDNNLVEQLEGACKKIGIKCVPVLANVINAIGDHLGAKQRAQPGKRHALDDEYFHRIDAMQFVLNHDDGQMTQDLDDADVIIVGVSRTSKTPTCIYLANRGLKAANVPLVPGVPLPQHFTNRAKGQLVVGLIAEPRHLVEIRRARLRILNQIEETEYVDFDHVSREVNDAKRLFTKNGWPVINVTRRSIEETAATIIQHHNRLVEKLTQQSASGLDHQ